MKKFLIIVSAIVVGGIILVVGCSVIVGNAMNDAEEKSKEGGISKTEYRSIKIGTSRVEIVKELGKPDGQDHMNIEGLGRSACIYYPDEEEFLTRYQFCFDNKDKLESKSYL